jgi:hypothetical protein
MINLQGDHTSMAMCLLARYTLDDSVKLVYILLSMRFPAAELV